MFNLCSIVLSVEFYIEPGNNGCVLCNITAFMLIYNNEFLFLLYISAEHFN